MRRLLSGATIAAVLALSAPALAGTGARLTFNHPQHTFTLQSARSLDQRYEHKHGWAIQGTVCGWVRLHVAGCASKLAAVVIDGQAALTYTIVDDVTRSGACSNPGRIVKRVGGVTYQDGDRHFGNCFTGPLVVLPQGIY